MNTKLPLTVMTALALALSGSVFAQSDADKTPSNSSTSSTQSDDSASSSGAADAKKSSDAPTPDTVETQKSSEMLAKDIIGMPVKNGSGDDAEEIGEITDVVLDGDKQVVNVVIGVGGFLGIGAKHVGVPLDKVSFSSDSETAIVDVTKEDLEDAPSYKTLSKQEDEQEQEAQKQKMQQQQQSEQAPAGGGTM